MRKSAVLASRSCGRPLPNARFPRRSASLPGRGLAGRACRSCAGLWRSRLRRRSGRAFPAADRRVLRSTGSHAPARTKAGHSPAAAGQAAGAGHMRAACSPPIARRRRRLFFIRGGDMGGISARRQRQLDDLKAVPRKRQPQRPLQGPKRKFLSILHLVILLKI